MEPDYIRAYKHASNHRDEVLASSPCGCFCCRRVYAPGEIKDWVDEHGGSGMTALCPRCGIDSVIGFASGFPIMVDFLARMKRHWR